MAASLNRETQDRPPNAGTPKEVPLILGKLSYVHHMCVHLHSSQMCLGLTVFQAGPLSDPRTIRGVCDGVMGSCSLPMEVLSGGVSVRTS